MSKYHRDLSSKISSEPEYDEIYNPIEDIMDILNYCRQDYYKLYKKDFKVAPIRLRHNLQKVIEISKEIKKEVLNYRKDIEERERIAKEEAKDSGIL